MGREHGCFEREWSVALSITRDWLIFYFCDSVCLGTLNLFRFTCFLPIFKIQMDLRGEKKNKKHLTIVQVTDLQ